VEAAAQTQGTVTLKARATAKHVIVEVADTGNGMPPKLIREAFEPFVTTKERGTGLGLPLAKRIIESHRGRVRVRSVPKHGTCVTVWLPLALPLRPQNRHGRQGGV